MIAMLSLIYYVSLAAMRVWSFVVSIYVLDCC